MFGLCCQDSLLARGPLAGCGRYASRCRLSISRLSVASFSRNGAFLTREKVRQKRASKRATSGAMAGDGESGDVIACEVPRRRRFLAALLIL